MRAPNAAELLQNPVVQLSLEQAWADSLVNDPAQRHEEGGWIYCEPGTGTTTVKRAQPGTNAEIDLDSPPLVPGYVVVATFHTHPNPSAEGWVAGPSEDDIQFAHEVGVPFLIRADNGCHVAGPNARRGGMNGNPGFPD